LPEVKVNKHQTEIKPANHLMKTPQQNFKIIDCQIVPHVATEKTENDRDDKSNEASKTATENNVQH
jgi:hypothetical protein